ncbi:MAG: RHS repeat-associated core domain-containing protein [Planctomycetota bacterium]|nr:MAG: RHS repeat-associated core domain-containing protein [Planctomycetota bacterium]REK45964.1 MAG: RHS repeat-associated core domain-containing protein [Planctomycetota bacterium]
MNVTALVDASTGLVVERYHYDSYGQVEFLNDVFASLGTQATQYGNDFLYTGRKLDSETGLMYYRARYYDPALGKFVQRDPIGYSAGDSNLYRYVGNSPVNAVDPSGMHDEIYEVTVTVTDRVDGLFTDQAKVDTFHWSMAVNFTAKWDEAGNSTFGRPPGDATLTLSQTPAKKGGLLAYEITGEARLVDGPFARKSKKNPNCTTECSRYQVIVLVSAKDFTLDKALGFFKGNVAELSKEFGKAIELFDKINQGITQLGGKDLNAELEKILKKFGITPGEGAGGFVDAQYVICADGYAGRLKNKTAVFIPVYQLGQPIGFNFGAGKRKGGTSENSSQ